MTHLTNTQKRRGVITMSAANHAQAVAFRARQEGAKATIVMPNRPHLPRLKEPAHMGQTSFELAEVSMNAKQR